MRNGANLRRFGGAELAEGNHKGARLCVHAILGARGAYHRPGNAQTRSIEARQPSGCRLDADPSTSHCNARRCTVCSSWPRGPESADGNGLSGGPGSIYQFGERQCPTILAANAARSVVHRAAHQSLARCMHTNRKSHAGRRPAGLDIYLFTWHRKTILSSCACCCCSAVLTYDLGRGFTS